MSCNPILNKATKTWSPGKVTDKCQEPRSYIVETPAGARARRNRSHIRERAVTPTAHDDPMCNKVSLTTTETHGETHAPATTSNYTAETTQEKDKEMPDYKSPSDPANNKACTTRSGRVVRAPQRYVEQ